MNKIKLLIAAATLCAGLAGNVSTESLICKLEPLEAHSFTQQSDYEEFVCVSPANKADFVIFVSEFKGEYRLDDLLSVELNVFGEVLPIHTVLLNEGGDSN